MNLSFPINSIELIIEKEADYKITPLYSTSMLQISETDFSITIDGVAKYRVQNGNKVWITPCQDADQSSIQLFLNGSVFGAVLHQRGIIPFHGCSFEYGGKGVLICGHSGTGKSSVTAAFCQKGAHFINDDITPVSIKGSEISIIPIHSQMKLWDDSMKALEIETNNLVQIRPSMEKFYVPFSNTYDTNLHLDTLLILDTHECDEYEANRPIGMGKYNLLRKNIYRKMYLRGMPQTAKNLFENLFTLTEIVKVIHILRPITSDINSTMEFIRKQLEP